MEVRETLLLLCVPPDRGGGMEIYMKKRKRFFSALLAFAAMTGLVCGCGGGDAVADSETSGVAIDELDDDSGEGQKESGSEKMGRFLESQVELPVESMEDILCLGKSADGTIVAMASDGGGSSYLLTSSDMGENWNSTKTQVKDAYVTSGGVTADGGAILEGYFEDGEAKIKKVAPDGTVSDINPQLPGSGDDPSILQCGVDAAGNLYVMDLQQNIYQIDMAGGAAVKLECSDPASGFFGIAGNRILTVTQSGILIYNLAENRAEEPNEALDEAIRQNTDLAAKGTDRGYPIIFNEGVEQDSIIYATHQGVFYCKAGAGMAEQLINGELCSLGDTGASLFEIIMLDEENFLAHISDSSGREKLLKFTYDKTVSAVPDKQLIIYALEESSLLRKAASIYQNENQDVYVKIEIGLSGVEGITAEDALSALNTRILAGDAPDLFVLDGLPVESYIEKGVLSDISNFVQQLEQDGGLFTNVTDHYKKDGAYYELPVCFYPLLVQAPAEMMNHTKDLTAFADYVERATAEGDTKVLSLKNAHMLLKILFLADANNWIKDGRPDSAQLEAWLSAAKKLYDANGAKNEERGVWSNMDGYLLSSFNEGDLMLGDAKAEFGTVVDIVGFVNVLAGQEEHGYDYDVLNKDRGNCFVPYLSMGIGSSTDAREEAEAFLALLFGEECAGADTGFPVTRKSWEKVRENGLTTYGPDSQISIGAGTPDGRHYGFTMNQFNEEAADQLESILLGLDVSAVADAAVQNIVLDAAENYLKGNATLQDALSAIEQKLTLYLNE